jgi:hypothetical protein
VGNIQGAVSAALVSSACVPGVYLYSGMVAAPEDMNSAAATTDANQPIASKALRADSPTPYYYQFTFLEPGTYTLAFTCQADQVNPVQSDAAVTLTPVNRGISVTANMTTTADIS